MKPSNTDQDQLANCNYFLLFTMKFIKKKHKVFDLMYNSIACLHQKDDAIFCETMAKVTYLLVEVNY